MVGYNEPPTSYAVLQILLPDDLNFILNSRIQSLGYKAFAFALRGVLCTSTAFLLYKLCIVVL